MSTGQCKEDVKMPDDEIKQIFDDTESLLKRITHKICDILIGSGKKKMEKICSKRDIIVHIKGKNYPIDVDEGKDE